MDVPVVSGGRPSRLTMDRGVSPLIRQTKAGRRDPLTAGTAILRSDAVTGAIGFVDDGVGFGGVGGFEGLGVPFDTFAEANGEEAG